MKNQKTLSPQSDRRKFLKQSFGGLGALAFLGLGSREALANPGPVTAQVPQRLDFESETYPFALPPLPYPFDAMVPYIDARTMEIHYTKHHAGYVRKLNAALANHPELHRLTLSEMITDLDAVPESIRTAVRNNGGGHLNHCLFWYSLKNGPSNPSSKLKAKIGESFESETALLDAIASSGLGRFGSGWAWLCEKPDGSLTVISTPNQDSPWMGNPELRPLLGVDVWEHAYYLKYQNRRGDYLNAWKNIVDWNAVSERLAG